MLNFWFFKTEIAKSVSFVIFWVTEGFSTKGFSTEGFFTETQSFPNATQKRSNIEGSF